MSNDQLNGLAQTFKDEEKELISAGINTWYALSKIEDKEINLLAAKGRSSTRNLKRLRGMANLVVDLNLMPWEASLLLYAGISSSKALASLTPQDLINKAGRLKRQLRISKEPVFNLAMASSLIKRAKGRQIQN